VSGTISRFGRLDVLINNAGVTADHLLGQLTEDDWRSVMEVNLKGAFLCSRAVIPQMIKQHDGHIINVSSYSARAGHTGQVNYAAAKAGLIGLTQALAREIGSRNVRANTVLPGLLKTAMTKGLSKDQLDALRRENALDRVNDVDEVAAFIGFLATTKNISGQLFQLDSRIAPWT
jgi:3-oxoacyl-[acyl-carrier protein] reductase